MLVAAIISLAAAFVIVVAVLIIRARSAPRRRRRQTETAARLFDDGAISAWSNNDSEEWSDDQREAALTYYNTAGRRARIGGIRADLIPDNHRSHIKRLTQSIGDDDASRAKWSDFLWLATRVGKQSSTSRSAAPQSNAEPPGGSEPPSADRAEIDNLAKALGLNGSTIELNEVEKAGGSTAPATLQGSSGNGHNTAHNHPSQDSAVSSDPDTSDPDTSDSDTLDPDTRDPENPDLEAPDADTPDSDTCDPDNPDLEAPDAVVHDPDVKTPDGQDTETACGDASTLADQDSAVGPDGGPTSEAEAESPLPDVPAWILEARAALPRAQSPDPGEAGAMTSPDPSDPKPILAGTDFPWPRTAIGAQQVTIPDDVPEPVDFIPDVDVGELAIVDDGNTADSKSGFEVADSEQSAGESDDTATKLDEIRRLKRGAKKARTSSEEATRLTVKYAREGRRKRARAAGNLAFEQAELAKRLRKRARKLERSLKN